MALISGPAWAACAFLAAGCVTRAPEGYAPIGGDAPVARYLETMARRCLDAKRGAFLADMKATGLPPVAMEGTWTRGFETLTALILTPLGDDVARFDFSAGDAALRLADEFEPQRQNVEALAGLITQIGPAALRHLMCGLQFGGMDGVSVFAVAPELKVDPHDRSEFRSRGTLVFGEHALKVDSAFRIDTFKDPDLLVGESTLKGGLFSSAAAQLSWQGNIVRGAPRPQMISLRSEALELTLSFAEFE